MRRSDLIVIFLMVGMLVTIGAALSSCGMVEHANWDCTMHGKDCTGPNNFIAPAGEDGESIEGPAGESVTGPMGPAGETEIIQNIEAGEPCSVIEIDGGVLVVCPDGSSAKIEDGQDGESIVGPTGDPGIAGTPGESCYIERVNRKWVKLYCPDSEPIIIYAPKRKKDDD